MHKVQCRTLQQFHMDAHYCAKNHKNIRQYSVLVKMLEDAGCVDLVVAYVSSNDKAKVGIGEPKLPISLSARGKANLVPVSEDGKSHNDASDHDYSGQSLVSSMHLISFVLVHEDRNVDEAKPALYRGEQWAFVFRACAQCMLAKCLLYI